VQENFLFLFNSAALLLQYCIVMFLIRLLIVGDSGVGKTSLLVRFHENQFMFTQKTTIGVDYKAKECEVDGELVKLQVRRLALRASSSIIHVIN
jgi:GTPase SAR1 family protein